jgi:hypothetical protein
VKRLTSTRFNPNLTTSEVLETLRSSGKPLHEWGQAIDGTALLSGCTGGRKQPCIFITAGAHCTETGGIHAALNLLEQLDSEHKIYVLPLRDPFGFAGVNHCLSFASGELVYITSHQEALEFLLGRAQLLWSEDALRLFQLGQIGFVWHSQRLPSEERFINIHSRMLSLSKENPNVLKSLCGKRVMVLNSMPDVEGVGEIGRCWHGVVSTNGEWMHLNRFFNRPDAPSEVAAIEHLLQALRPGLTLDLHEGNGRGFWLPVERNEQYLDQLFTMSQAFFDYVHNNGYPITDYEDWVATDETLGKNYAPDWLVPELRLPGMFWVNGRLRGEGYNLMDYVGNFGIGFGTESPMGQPLAIRIDVLTHGIQAVIKTWENFTL